MSKAVILARGLGTRMRKKNGSVSLSPDQEAVADKGVKAMVPIGRPFLDYVLDALADAGYERVCLVVGPEHREIRRYYGEEVSLSRLSVEFAIQEKPLGTADAVAAAEEFAGDDFFLVINSDNYYPPEVLSALRELNGYGLVGFRKEGLVDGSNIPPERISRFAVIEMDGSDKLVRIIEKPDEEVLKRIGEPVYVSMNCWRFGKEIFDACRRIPLSPRGEYEITDAVQMLVEKRGVEFKVVKANTYVLDMTYRADIAPVAERLAGKEVVL